MIRFKASSAGACASADGAKAQAIAATATEPNRSAAANRNMTPNRNMEELRFSICYDLPHVDAKRIGNSFAGGCYCGLLSEKKARGTTGKRVRGNGRCSHRKRCGGGSRRAHLQRQLCPLPPAKRCGNSQRVSELGRIVRG